MQDRFQACEPERLVALLDLDADAPPPTGSSFVADSDARTVLDPQEIPQIDGYDITGRLGEGGMGVVWRAVQRGTRRPVALKVRPQFARGGSRARLRFEREVELAARLEHPHVARVYDSGVCRGLDYYGMELVDGQHLDRYVADHKLGTRQILALMRDVCLAVHYAHQRGVIHRDLKPSNILVTNDGKPHVVDFGLAKALAEESDDPALTQEGQYAGTPAFMSPEQAAGRVNEIDTRTDVWGLGATLYLLLTGQAAHDTRGQPYEVIRRIATEEVRPPRQLNKQIDVELEALLLKVLAREPNARYSSAAELAQEIERYLNGEPLLAARPSRVYRLRKYAWRHRLPLSIAAAFVLLLMSATVISLYQARQIARERDQALVEKRRADEQAAIAEGVNEFQSSMLSGIEPERGNKPHVTVREVTEHAISALDKGQLKDKPIVEASVRTTIGNTLRALGEIAECERHLQKAVELRRQAQPGDAKLAMSLDMLAQVKLAQHKLEEAEELEREALTLRRAALPPDHEEVTVGINNLAAMMLMRGKAAEAEPLLREALERYRKETPPRARMIAGAMHNVGNALSAQGKMAEAERVIREALAMYREDLGTKHMRTGGVAQSLATLLKDQGRMGEAELLMREALDAYRAHLPPDHPEVARGASGLGEVLASQRKADEAESLLREALEIQRKKFPDGHPSMARTLNALAGVARARGDLATAERAYRDSIAMAGKSGSTEQLTINGKTGLAGVLRRQGKLSEAEHMGREALSLARDFLPAGHVNIVAPALALAAVWAEQGRFQDVVTLLDEVKPSDQDRWAPASVATHTFYKSLCLAELQRWDEAEPLLRSAHEQLTANAWDPGMTREVLSALAALCDATGRPDEAAKWRAERAALKATSQPTTTLSTSVPAPR